MKRHQFILLGIILPLFIQCESGNDRAKDNPPSMNKPKATLNLDDTNALNVLHEYLKREQQGSDSLTTERFPFKLTEQNK